MEMRRNCCELSRSRDSRGPRYPELRGDKIRLMWVRMMAEPGKAEIRRLETVPVAVDVQVRRVTENLGVTNTYGPELNNRIKKQIQQAWSDGVAAARIGRSGTDRRNVLRARSGALVLRQARVQPLRDGEATGALRSGVRRLSVSASSTIGLRSGQPFRPPAACDADLRSGDSPRTPLTASWGPLPGVGEPEGLHRLAEGGLLQLRVPTTFVRKYTPRAQRKPPGGSRAGRRARDRISWTGRSTERQGVRRDEP